MRLTGISTALTNEGSTIVTLTAEFTRSEDIEPTDIAKLEDLMKAFDTAGDKAATKSTTTRKPRKAPAEEVEDVEDVEEETSEEKPKRGRGRPRKKPEAEPEAEAEPEEEAPRARKAPARRKQPEPEADTDEDMVVRMTDAMERLTEAYIECGDTPKKASDDAEGVLADLMDQFGIDKITDLDEADVEEFKETLDETVEGAEDEARAAQHDKRKAK